MIKKEILTHETNTNDKAKEYDINELNDCFDTDYDYNEKELVYKNNSHEKNKNSGEIIQGTNLENDISDSKKISIKTQKHEDYDILIDLTKKRNSSSKKEKICTIENNSCNKVTGITLESCVNTPVKIDYINNIVAKIPVVLAEFTLQIDVLSNIKLPENAVKIKHVKKRLKITQFALLQNKNTLFLKGFVRNNISYSTKSCSNSEGLCNDVKHCTMDVPFECTTPITFNGTDPEPASINTSPESECQNPKDNSNTFEEDDKLIAEDLSEYNQESIEYFNEPPYYELVKSRIVEFNKSINPKVEDDDTFPFEEKEFNQIEEKMVIYLTLKLLQNLPVSIS